MLGEMTTPTTGDFDVNVISIIAPCPSFFRFSCIEVLLSCHTIRTRFDAVAPGALRTLRERLQSPLSVFWSRPRARCGRSVQTAPRLAHVVQSPDCLVVRVRRPFVARIIAISVRFNRFTDGFFPAMRQKRSVPLGTTDPFTHGQDGSVVVIAKEPGAKVSPLSTFMFRSITSLRSSCS